MPLKRLSLSEVVEKLIELSKVINNRTGLKPREEARVDEAFSLLVAAQCRRKKQPYQEHLQRVNKRLGGYAVVLCAALGPSAVLALKDRDRVELVMMLEQRKDDIVKDELQGLANKYTD
ncbi:hypothetical protein B0I35DRAFT_321367, partial [Stachybotrys elegans]